MRRILISAAMVIVIAVGAWALYHKDQIKSPQDFVDLAKSQLGSFSQTKSQFANFSRSYQNSIRVASFNIQVFGEKKSQRPEVMATLAAIVREFDIVAIQEIRNNDKTLLARFVDEINSTGRRFQFVASEPLGSSNYREQYAYIFDSSTVTMDGAQSYTIHDPDDLLRREPLVGWFRTQHADPRKAFTFTLVNLHLDSRSPQREVVHLNQIFRAIRNDGRGEDDVIIVGDFNLSGEAMAAQAKKSGLTWLISNQPTNTRSTKQYDNIIVDLRATTEFTGRAGVFDFLQHFNMTIEEALRVSDHLPVWAEFQLQEGGQTGQMASQGNNLF